MCLETLRERSLIQVPKMTPSAPFTKNHPPMPRHRIINPKPSQNPLPTSSNPTSTTHNNISLLKFNRLPCHLYFTPGRFPCLTI